LDRKDKITRQRDRTRSQGRDHKIEARITRQPTGSQDRGQGHKTEDRITSLKKISQDRGQDHKQRAGSQAEGRVTSLGKR